MNSRTPEDAAATRPAPDAEAAPKRRDSTPDSVVEKTITTIAGFVVAYLLTVWTLLAYPFRHRPELLAKDTRRRTMAPYSFLFVCSAIFYFAGERMEILITYLSSMMDVGPARPLNLFADLASASYSPDAFALKTAPTVALIIAVANLAGWLAGSGSPLRREQLRSAVCYLSGFLLLLASLATLAVLLELSHLIAQLPGAATIEDTIPTLVIAIGVFAVLILSHLLVTLIAYGRTIAAGLPAGAPRFWPAAGCIAALLLATAGGAAGSTWVTGFQLGGSWKSAADAGRDRLAGTAVLFRDAGEAARQGLRLAVAATNLSHDPILLLTCGPARAHLRVVGGGIREWDCKFKPAPGGPRFTEIGPGATVTFEGTLDVDAAVREAIAGERKNGSVRLEVVLIGSVPGAGGVKLYMLVLENRPGLHAWSPLLFSGFDEPAPAPNPRP